MLRKFIVSLIFFLIIIGIYFIFADKTGYYYNRVFSADKIKITDIDKGENVIYVVDGYKRKDIISSFSLVPKSKANFMIQDTQINKVEFLKKEKVLLTVFVGKVQSCEEEGDLSFQPTTSEFKNTIIYEYKGEKYICYTGKFYISWSEAFYEIILDRIGS